MITLAFGGFGIAKTAALQLKANPDSGFWAAPKYQTSHVEWVGCGYTLLHVHGRLPMC
jgi:hypothetical protein